MVTARHPRSEQRTVASDHRPYIVTSIERDRTPQIESRAVTEQVLGHILSHLPEAGRPTKDANLGVVAFAVDVGTRLDQQPNRLKIAIHCREMQWRGVVGKFAAVEIGTTRDEQTYNVVSVVQGGQMQRGGLVKPTTGQRIDEVRACIEPLPQCLNVS